VFDRGLRFALACGLLLTGQVARAEEASETVSETQSGYQNVPVFGGPSSVGAELNEGDGLTDPIYRFDYLQRAFSPWFGLKGDLNADYGLSFAVDYQTLFQTVTDSPGEDTAAAGQFRAYGSWTLLGRDSGNTGSLVFKVEDRHRLGTDVAPQDLGFEAGALSITGTQFSDIGWALTYLYWQQRFQVSDRQVTFVAGQVDVTDYLDVYGLVNPLTAFSNLSFSTDPSIAAPNQGLGFAGGAFLTDHVYAVAGFADANGDATDPGFDLFDDFETFKHLELGWTSSYERRYFDNIHLTAWQVDERDDAGVPDDHGVAMSASWFVDNRWVPFLRGGWSEGDAALMQGSISTGLGYLNRHRDLMGLGLNWGDPGDDDLDDQYTAEVFYRFQFSQNFAITPSAQVILDPALNPDDDELFFFGLRARLNL
jgi:porin